MSNRIAFVLLCVISFAEARSADITMPAGLVPGDSYRVVFVTSSNFGFGKSDRLGDISMYNTLITNYGQGTLTGRLNTSWTAIVSTLRSELDAPIDARDNTMTNPDVHGLGVPIYLTDGLTRIADNYVDLWDGSIASPINLDENGDPPMGNEVKTGTEPDGTASPQFALGPTSRMGLTGPTSTVGLTTSPNGHWISAIVRDVGQGGKLYGISGVVTVVPEPSSTVLLGIAMLCLATCRRRFHPQSFATAPLLDLICIYASQPVELTAVGHQTAV